MTEPTLDVAQIKKLLPHRPPMLFVERLTDIVKMQSATGWKAVSIEALNRDDDVTPRVEIRGRR